MLGASLLRVYAKHQAIRMWSSSTTGVYPEFYAASLLSVLTTLTLAAARATE